MISVERGARFAPIEPQRYALHEFRCGEAALDDFLAHDALKDDEHGVSKTWVLPGDGSSEPRPVAAFFTLAYITLQKRDIPDRAFAENLPPYPLQTLLLARMGVHETLQGSGFGGLTLLSALRQCCAQHQAFGAVGIVVDSKNARVQKFYEKYGFVFLGDHREQVRLYMRIDAAKKLV